MSRSLVGITTYAEPVSHGPWRDQPAGGADIDPLRYADIRHPASDAPLTERDDTEIALVRRTAELDIPVLGAAACSWPSIPGRTCRRTRVHRRHHPLAATGRGRRGFT
ncbi:gamma-glutamyl-gamma-aminobutyrate hydrolase family protein [Yimella lutea]|uniref:gamma-glutamyl-gamma-aminobutyrate hydrolase family protein n=1 Tax=Yimella lutea TaxID=587872 RepID=UPI001476F89A|nr:gamma-glutamyl-gamma-aminobutyrate hydrolase family protein [Yimella lutea]